MLHTSVHTTIMVQLPDQTDLSSGGDKSVMDWQMQIIMVHGSPLVPAMMLGRIHC